MTLQTQRDYLHGLGGLIKLTHRSHLRVLYEPDFYRILGGETTLAYIKSLLTNPEEARRDWVAVYRDARENLEETIEALSHNMMSISEYEPFDLEEQIRETVLNYHQTKEEEAEATLPELRSRFQRYKLLLENSYDRIRLTKQEEADKQDFIKMLDFFLRLEQNYSGWKQHQDSFDE